MRYIFDDYVLDTQRHELHGVGRRIHLRPKVFQVLAYLLAHRDRVVPKAELLEHAWPNQFIGDATLNSCIKAVRQALGDGGRTPRFLHTLHGQGYRFVATVVVQEHSPVDAAPPALPLHGGEGDTRPLVAQARRRGVPRRACLREPSPQPGLHCTPTPGSGLTQVA